MFSEIPFPDGIAFLGRHGISTFSLLLMLSFLAASFWLPHELRRKGLDPAVSDWMILYAVLGAIIGSKVFFVWEVWDRIWVIDISFWNTLYRVFFTWDGMRHVGGESMWKHLFGGSGLVFYGGLIFSCLFICLYLRIKKLEIWRYGDSIIMFVALGYAIGRIGCFVSGDGCFGHGSNANIPLLTWVYGPSDGNCPSDPSLAWKYPYICTAGIRVWNTPVIESLFSFGLFGFFMLWVRFKNFRPGISVAIFMVWNAVVRFFVEFIRLNDAAIPILSPPTASDEINTSLLHNPIKLNNNFQDQAEYFANWHWYGITQSQIVAIVLFIVGLSWIFLGKLYKSPSQAECDQQKGAA